MDHQVAPAEHVPQNLWSMVRSVPARPRRQAPQLQHCAEVGKGGLSNQAMSRFSGGLAGFIREMIKVTTLPVATRDVRARSRRRIAPRRSCLSRSCPSFSGLNMRKLLATLVISCWATLAYAQ